MRRARHFALCAILVVVVTAVCATIAIRSTNLHPGRFDKEVSAQIRKLCGAQTDCVLRMGNLAAGDWDRLYRFSSDTPITEIERELQITNVRRSELQGTAALVKSGRVVFLENYDEGFEAPIAGSVSFAIPSKDQRAAGITPDSNMRVDQEQVDPGKNGPLQPGGTYYILTPL